MGLLDQLDDPVNAGLLSMGLRLMSTPGKFGQALGSAGLGAMGDIQALRQQQEQRKMREQQMQVQAAQLEDIRQQSALRQAQAAEQVRKTQEGQRIQGVIAQAVGGIPPINANAASGVAGPRPEALSVVGQPRAIDYQALIAQGVPPEIVKTLAESRNFGRDKVARTIKGMGPDGREYEYQVDEFGRRVGDGLAQYRAPISVNQGSKTTFADPYTLAPMGSFQTYQTPDGAASNALGWANFGLSKKRLEQEAGAGQLIEADGGYVRVGKDNRVTPIMTAEGKPLAGKGGAGTEDERKASSWVAQAENAWRNVLKVAFDKNGNLTADAKAKPYEGWTPEFVANAIRTSGRQQFLQGMSSMSEALLRAATGAGVNHDEAQQKIRELTPQAFDGPDVIAQKMNSIPVYLESLRVRAGKALPKGLPPVSPSPLGGGGGGWSITPVPGGN